MKTAKEMNQHLDDATKKVSGLLLNALLDCTDDTEFRSLVSIAYRVDMHRSLGALIARKANDFGITELYVGEYDVDGSYLKIKEVPEEDDYYGFSEVEIGEWVSSNY